MNKKQSLILFSLFDLLFIGGMVILAHEFSRISSDVIQQVEMIKFGNRFTFLIVGAVIPMLHIWGIAEYFWPRFVKKNTRIISCSLIACLIVLLSAGFVGSAKIKAKIEAEGYVYCRAASGVSALAKSLVYTRDKKICEDIVRLKKQARR